MVGEDIEKKLYNSASEGALESLQQLVRDDPHLVDRVSYPCSRNLLHIATLRGQANIVQELLKINRELARDVDSKNSSPLHIAAAKGHVEIMKKLLARSPEMLWCRDGQGMNPVHVAAVNGHVEILEEMLRLDPGPAMERVHRGQTVLHLCVKHRRLRALEFFVEKLGELVAAKDDDGETPLHWAARKAANEKELASFYYEIISSLVSSKKIKKKSLNSMGKTAKQILEEGIDNFEGIQYLKNILSSNYYDEPFFGFLSNPSVLELISKRREQTMVVMTLIATMAFQAAVSPPGGVWQDDTSSHRAGEAVIASTHPKMYRQFVRANTTAFVSSLLTIFLLAVLQRVEKDFLLLFSNYAVWASLASVAVSYGCSVLVTARPNADTESLDEVIEGVVAVSLIFFGATLLLHPMKWFWSWIKTTKRVQSLLHRLDRVFIVWQVIRVQFHNWVTGFRGEQNQT